MDGYLIAYYIGIFIVFASHIFMLAKPAALSSARDMQIHAYVNIFAGLCIAAWFMKSQGYL